MIAVANTRSCVDLSHWRVAFVLASFLSLSIASYLGFLAPDSTAYLSIAQSIVDGQGCSIDGHYSAVWPCGYPAAIAAFGFLSHDYVSLILASKIVNFFLVVGGMLMLNNVIRDYRIVLLATVNPINWAITYWTISENLSNFALCGVIFATKNLCDAVAVNNYNRARAISWSGAVLVFIVVGFLARYFFATFATVLYAATLFAYGRRTAVAALPAYALAAVLFLVLMHYNSHSTGFGTGMARLPAQESTRFLLLYFSLQSIRVLAMLLPVFLILWPEYVSSFNSQRNWAGVEAGEKSALSYFLLITGIGYIVLLFLIRFLFTFDLFTFRLIGPGFVLLACGLALAKLSNRPTPGKVGWFGPSLKTVFLAAYCTVASQTLLPLGAILADWRSGRAISAHELFLNSKAPPTSAKVIFSVRRPMLSPALNQADEYYYGPEKTIIYPDLAPVAPPDTAETYRAKLQKYANADCVLDFTLFNSDDDFRKALSAMDYDVDVSLSGLKPIRIKRPALDPSLKDFLEKVFEPSQYVSCRQALAANHSP